jgi:hypothetical protein
MQAGLATLLHGEQAAEQQQAVGPLHGPLPPAVQPRCTSKPGCLGIDQAFLVPGITGQHCINSRRTRALVLRHPGPDQDQRY